MQPNERFMYVTHCSPKYSAMLKQEIDFIPVDMYEHCGYGFITDPMDKNEVGLMSTDTTITRFIEDPSFKGRVELRQYLFSDGTDLLDDKYSSVTFIHNYEDHDITPLSCEYLNEGEKEVGAIINTLNGNDILRIILLPKKTAQQSQSPLVDTGDRTDLVGSGGLRDLNPENGRCDLLPASAINQFMSNTGLITRPQDSKNPSLVTAFHYIMQFMDWGDKQFLNEALTCIQTHHWYKDKAYSECGSDTQDMIFAKAMMDLSVHYKNGALKYAERNWEKGLPIHSFIDSAVRHLCKEMLGWDDEPHDIAVMWNLYGALWTLQHHPHLNDLPYYNNHRKENDNEVKEEATCGGNTSENLGEQKIYKKGSSEISFREACEEVGVPPFSEKKI